MTEQERIKEIEERQLYVWPHLTAESLEHDLCLDVRWLLDELKRVTAERDRMKDALESARRHRGSSTDVEMIVKRALQDGEKE